MDYRARWQHRRRRESRHRILLALGIVALPLLASLGFARLRRAPVQWTAQWPGGGPVYCAAHDGVLFGLVPRGTAVALGVADGRPMWPPVFKRSRVWPGPPGVSADHVVCVSEDGAVLALGSRSGEVLWEVETGAAIRCHPLAHEGVVYVGSDAGTVYALGLSDGLERWRYQAGAPVNSGFVVARGTLVFGTADGKIVGVRRDSGSLAWDVVAGFGVFATPAALDGLVAVGTDGGRLYLIDPDTGVRTAEADVPEGGLIRSAPVADEAAVYVATTDGWVVAYQREQEYRHRRLTRVWATRIGRGVLRAGHPPDRVGGTLRGRRRSQISAGPILDGRYLYCTNGARDIVALDKSDGRVRRRWRCPDKVQGSLVVTRGMLIAGTADGRAVAFRVPGS